MTTREARTQVGVISAISSTIPFRSTLQVLSYCCLTCSVLCYNCCLTSHPFSGPSPPLFVLHVIIRAPLHRTVSLPGILVGSCRIQSNQCFRLDGPHTAFVPPPHFPALVSLGGWSCSGGGAAHSPQAPAELVGACLLNHSRQVVWLPFSR